MISGRRVILIGRYPPPVGGISIHVARLAHGLRNRGIEVSVIDPYSRQLLRIDRSGPVRVKLSYTTLRSALNLFRGGICHVHVSTGRRFYHIATLVRLACRGATKRVLTVHSGSWIEFVSRGGWVRRAVIMRSLGMFDDIVCVNQLQRSVVERMVPPSTRVHVIPAYLAPPKYAADLLPSAVSDLIHKIDVLIVTSGYGTPIYDYLTVIKAVEKVQEYLTLRVGLVIATYTRWDRHYWDEVLRLLSRTRVACVAVTNLDEREFIALLSKAMIYVRATLTDGDSVTIREAGALGVKVIASAVVPRPSGALLFAPGDVDDLAKKLVAAICDRNAGKIDSDCLQSNLEQILSVYELA